MTGIELAATITAWARTSLALGMAYESVRDIATSKTEMTLEQFDMLLGDHATREGALTDYYRADGE